MRRSVLNTHSGPWRAAARTTFAAAAVLAAAAILAGCGGGSDSASTTTGKNRDITALQTGFVDTIRSVSPSVVQVETNAGLGSGVVIDGRGNIVTNHHVVGSAKRVHVTDASGRRYPATVVGVFTPDDLAVVRVNGARLPAASLGDSAALEVGDIVVAIGNPLGLQSSVTSGIVSALGRTVSEQNGVALPDVIQTSAAINPGNSGGALVDLSGRVIGIPTLAAIDPENHQLAGGIGFAIPSNTVKEIAGQIIQHGRVVDSDRAYLGVRLATLRSGRGVLVVSATRGGPAASAGIVAGDTVTAIDGHVVTSVDDVATTLADLRPGATATILVHTAAGQAVKLTVTLGQINGT